MRLLYDIAEAQGSHVVLKAWKKYWISKLSRDRPIYWPIFGFYWYIGISQNGQFYQPQ